MPVSPLPAVALVRPASLLVTDLVAPGDSGGQSDPLPTTPELFTRVESSLDVTYIHPQAALGTMPPSDSAVCSNPLDPPQLSPFQMPCERPLPTLLLPPPLLRTPSPSCRRSPSADRLVPLPEFQMPREHPLPTSLLPPPPLRTPSPSFRRSPSADRLVPPPELKPRQTPPTTALQVPCRRPLMPSTTYWQPPPTTCSKCWRLTRKPMRLLRSPKRRG